MLLPSNPLPVRVLSFGLAAVWLLGGDAPGGALGASRTASRATTGSPIGHRLPGDLLAAVRPDYRTYIDAIRPISETDAAPPGRRPIYMALVRPGADDPVHRDSAPYAGAGARNDILYARSSFDTSRTMAWSILLLDHEYFHARHLAGTTSLPLPSHLLAEGERHFFEAAAWGFNVAEARAGRYPGLREVEFREALNRYGEHYRALRSLLADLEPAGRQPFVDLVRTPAELLRTADSRPASVLSRPAAPDRSATTP